MNYDTPKLTKMYYVPPAYYWINNIYNEVKSELYTQYVESKNKSNLIRIILIDFAHFHPNKTGKDLILNIFDKWNQNKKIKQNNCDLEYNQIISNIIKNEKVINNIEEILILIDLEILENYYE